MEGGGNDDEAVDDDDPENLKGVLVKGVPGSFFPRGTPHCTDIHIGPLLYCLSACDN